MSNIYKLRDMQGTGMKESLQFSSLEEVRQHLIAYHSQDTELSGNETLEDMLEVGVWEVYRLEKHICSCGNEHDIETEI